jgi:hypothetical protein
MKRIAKFKYIAALFFLAANGQSLLAQTNTKIDASTPITWLGVDYSQAKFIGSATQFENAGKITNAEFQNVYTVAWNQLFINEQKKYDVASALHRSSVKYDIDVALKANAALQKDFFSNNPSDFKTLDASKIADIVSKYNFGNDQGIGLIFFVEGMSKGAGSEGVWVTFVDMKSKTVLSTDYRTGKPGGFGFRNYWAKPLYTILKEGIKY